MAKRLFDISFSLLALSLFALPMLIIAALLRYKEGHGVFFRQTRIGKEKREFEILKFQTLVNEVATPTGRVLRRTGIDEWPQFINVLRGEMSIVGPRALTASRYKTPGLGRQLSRKKVGYQTWDIGLCSALWRAAPQDILVLGHALPPGWKPTHRSGRPLPFFSHEPLWKNPYSQADFPKTQLEISYES